MQSSIPMSPRLPRRKLYHCSGPELYSSLNFDQEKMIHYTEQPTSMYQSFFLFSEHHNMFHENLDSLCGTRVCIMHSSDMKAVEILQTKYLMQPNLYGC